MLEKFREWGDSWIAKILLGILVLSFGLFFGMTDIFQGHHPLATVATVGEVPISTQDFRRSLEQYIRLLEQSSGRHFSPEQLSQLNIPGQVLMQLIHESLLDQEIDKMNLTISDEQIRKALEADSHFQNEQKVFDRELFERSLRAQGVHEKAYIALLRKQLRRAQWTQALLAPLHIPDVLVTILQQAQNQKRSGVYLFIAGKDQKVAQTPDEKTLKDFYDKYSFFFRLPERRSFTLLRIGLKEKNIGSERQEALYVLGKKIDDDLASGETLEEVAKANDLTLERIERIALNGQLDAVKKTLPFALDSVFAKYVLEQVFAADAETDMPVMRTPEGEQFVFRVDEIFPESTPVFEEIQGRVHEVWLEAQKNILAQKAAEALAQDITAGHASERGFAYLKAVSLEDKPSKTVPEAVFDALFRLAPGECCAVPAEQGAYVVRLTQLHKPTLSNIKKLSDKNFETDLFLALKDNLLQGYLQNLKPLYPIKLNEKALQAAF